MKNLIVTITGPSCAGKSTLERMLREKLGFESVMSTTTRPKRDGEVDGENYNFVSREAFEKNKADGCYIENVEFNGNLYGVSSAEAERVFAKGKPVVVVVEPNGMTQIVDYAHGKGWGVFPIFLCNKASVIAERFMNRFVAEVATRPAEETAKAVETYSARLAVMLTEEIDWQFHAFSGESPYAMKVWQFDESNSQDVLDAIKQYAIDGVEIAQ